ncbi:MAG TPA: Ig-like domain-containing protein [Gemmatimonadales bacterium]
MTGLVSHPRTHRLRVAAGPLLPCLLSLSLAFLSTSCVDNPPLGPGSGSTARLGLLASIAGLSADGDYTVGVEVAAVGDEGLRFLTVEPKSFPLSAADATVQPVIVNLIDCPDGCRLTAILTLSDDVGELASDTIDLGVVHQGDQLTPADTVTLIPQYQLTISGGGDGTGSGTIDIPAAGGEPAVKCAITDGQAADTGCDARYPFHTVITLVPTAPKGAALESWSGDCAGTAPDARCEVIMDGRRAAIVRFGIPPTTGDLEVQIAGLPSGAAAQVTVNGPGNFSRQLTASTSLTALPAGDYTVTAEPVTSQEQTYTPEPASQRITVVAGEGAVAQVAYNPPTTGTLAITITGLPDDVRAQVTAIGEGLPNGQTFSTSGQASNLEPGEYEVTAATVTGPTGQPYDATIAPAQPVEVSAGHVTAVTVTYTAPPAAGLIFTRQPGPAVSGIAISPAVTVEVRDAENRLVPGFTGQVTLSLQGGTPGATLHGTVAAIPERGVATFGNVIVDLAGSGYVLAASAQPLPTAESDTFTVVPGLVSPSRSSIELSRTNLRTCCDTALVTVTARDAAGNAIQGGAVTLSATGDRNIVLSPDSTTSSTGVTQGRFASRAIGTKTLSATINGVALTRGATIEVRAGVVFDRMLVLGDFFENDVYVMSPDGSDTVNITHDLGDQTDPAFSPDGSSIAFTVNGSIYVMNADGSGIVNVTPTLGGRSSHPAWSPDGLSLAFGYDQCGECGDEIVVMNRDGSNPVNVTIDSGGTSPSWSPGGGRIAFVRETCGESCRTDVWVMRRDGSQPVNLTGKLDGSMSSPAWSPDGLRIAFVLERCDTGCVTDLYTMDSSDGAHVVNVTNGRLGPVNSAAWSPDASRLLVDVQCGFDGPCNDDLILMDANGGNPRRVGQGSNPDWR